MRGVRRAAHPSPYTCDAIRCDRPSEIYSWKSSRVHKPCVCSTRPHAHARRLLARATGYESSQSPVVRRPLHFLPPSCFQAVARCFFLRKFSRRVAARRPIYGEIANGFYFQLFSPPKRTPFPLVAEGF